MMTRAERRRARERLNELERLRSLREPDRDNAATTPRFSVVINERVGGARFRFGIIWRRLLPWRIA